MKITVAKTNASFNLAVDKSYYDYSEYTISPGNIDNYKIYQRIGKGKYSEVFEGRQKKEKIVIKVLKPIRNSKINREILVLKNLSHKNIIALKDVVCDKSSETYSLIFPYIRHKDTCEIFEKMGLGEIKLYTRQILEALAYAHSRGIMHRDIKPQNMIINTDKKTLKIIDWGLAEFYHPEQEYSVRVSSRFYKGPELLVEYPYYDYSLDVWSFGVVLAEIVFKKMPFFSGLKNCEQIHELVRVMGRKDLISYVEKYEIPFEVDAIGPSERTALKAFIDEGEYHILEGAVDLLESILIYDHNLRPTAEECLNQRFYK
jgi:casein kinase II subunit alpha